MPKNPKRAHVVMEPDLIRAIGAVVVSRGRSKFIAEVADEKLRRLRLIAIAERGAGSLKDVEIPGWETSESAAAWVHGDWVADTHRLE